MNDDVTGGPFRQGLIRLSCRKTFTHNAHGTPVQYAGLCAQGKLLGTGDLVETDAKVICEIFNEGVLRRLAKRMKERRT